MIDLEKKCLVSIIVPVYKVEEFLPKCLDSILHQTLQEWECILIDDGSPDKSGNICDEYSMKDARFRVIHKENGGVSMARQVGIDNSRGDYCIHVDPDDWIESDMLDSLYQKAISEDADMVICDYIAEFPDKKICMPQLLNSYDHLAVLEGIYFLNIFGSCWNKLIRRDIITRYMIKFPEDVNYCEDVIFNTKLLLHDIKVVHLDKALYHYIRGRNINSLGWLQQTKEHRSICDIIAERNKNAFPIFESAYPDFVEKLKFDLKYLEYAQMRPWEEYHNRYQEINNRIKDVPYNCSKIKAVIVHYTVKYKKLYKWNVLLRKIKNAISGFPWKLSV